MTAYALSFADLMLVNGFKEAVRSDDQDTIMRVLFENGMEVSKAHSIRVCNHRTLTNKEFNGPRYEGEERLDDVWIKSGCASLEATIESAKDPSVRFDLRAMSHQVSQDRAWEQGE
jgi:hypothetical protein